MSGFSQRRALNQRRSPCGPLCAARTKTRTDGTGSDAALDRVLSEEVPVFATESYAEIYGAASAGGRWLAVSLITSAIPPAFRAELGPLSPHFSKRLRDFGRISNEKLKQRVFD